LDDPDFLNHFRDLSLGEMRRVNNLLTDLLALGKSASAEYRVVDPAATLEPVLRLMDSTANKRRVKLSFRAIGAVDPIWADPDQMKQIVLNLVLNAIEASPEGGDVAVTVRTGPRGGVILEVSDSGTGISHEQIEHIFDPFFTTKESGTGLGLALVHQIVLEHGGEISVDSIPGRGTRFRIALPAASGVLQPTGT
jgi:signal transduction histidine kinase